MMTDTMVKTDTTEHKTVVSSGQLFADVFLEPPLIQGPAGKIEGCYNPVTQRWEVEQGKELSQPLMKWPTSTPPPGTWNLTVTPFGFQQDVDPSDYD